MMLGAPVKAKASTKEVVLSDINNEEGIADFLIRVIEKMNKGIEE